MPDWKGMFKKGAELAQQAKSELERTGLLDQARQGSSPAPYQPETDGPAQVREILGSGHPDPFTLVTTEDVRAALGGGTVTGPTATYSDNSGGPAWVVQTANGEVSVDVHLYADPYDVEEMLGYGDDEIRWLADVEDRAAIAGDMAAVSRGGEILSVSLSGPDTGAYDAALEALIRAAAARLPDFTQYARRMSAPGGPVLTEVLPTEFVSSITGADLDTPSYNRGEDEIEVTWRERQTTTAVDEYGDSGPTLEVRVTHYLIDPMEKQQQLAQSGDAWAKAAVEFTESMKAEFAEHIKPVPGPWDEGYLGSDEAYFKKSGRSFKIEISGSRADTSAQVAALATRLGEAV